MAFAGEVEDVDRGFAFGIDEGYFDIAAVMVEDEGDLAEEAGDVLGYYLEEGGVGG